MAKHGCCWLVNIIILFSIACVACEFEECTELIYVKTGDVEWAATEAKVSLTIYDDQGNKVEIPDLKKKGVREPGHLYFDDNSLDIFVVTSKCLQSAPCKIVLSHDNSGVNPGWYVDYVEVTATGPGTECGKQRFAINQWLGLWAGVSLTVTKDQCCRCSNQGDHLKKFTSLSNVTRALARKTAVKSAHFG